MTALAAKIQKEAFKTAGEARLYQNAINLLRKNQRDPVRCVNTFLNQIKDPGALVIALAGDLLSNDKLHVMALQYLGQVADDMKGKVRSVENTGGGVVQSGREDQSITGATPTVHVSEHDRRMPGHGGEVHSPREGHSSTGLAASNSDPSESSEGGVRLGSKIQPTLGATQSNNGDGVHAGLDSQRNNGATPNEGDGVQDSFESQVHDGPVVNPPRINAAAMRSVKENTTSIFDTHRLIDGRSIGDIRFSEIDGLVAHNYRDAALLRQIKKMVVPSDPHAIVREVIKVDEMQKMLQKSAELADAMA